MNRILLLALCLAACDGAQNSDETGDLSPDPDGKADALTLTGAFEIDATRLHADDLVYVRLAAAPAVGDPSWVWRRCYDTPCTLFAPQDGTYQLYKSRSTGKKYIKFFTTNISGGKSPALIDIYQYTRSGTKLKLRKANTARTFTLDKFTDAAACAESGGTYTGGACDCTALGNGAFNIPAQFDPGMGGCFLYPDSGEDMCDSSGGAYTDDDNNLVGSWCECGVGRYFASGTGCTDVPR